MSLCVIAGGVGAARLLLGAQDVVRGNSLTAIVNVADDDVISGLSISPDLDTVVYTCAGAIDAERGWGLADETWRAMESQHRYTQSAERTDLGWFNLGDRDLGTHLYRTSRLAQGALLSEVTAEMAAAWELGLRVLPVSDDPIATRLVTADGEISFQDYFVRLQHGVEVRSVRFAGADQAEPAPGVLEAIASADTIIIAPSNPIVSIAPVLAVRGVREALIARRDDTVAISGIIGGKALKGPAARLLEELGHESSAVGVARIYTEIASTLLVDGVDAHLADDVEATGLRCVVTSTIMSSRADAATLTAACLEATRR